MDVGIGIVAKTHPMGHYDHLFDFQHSAFFDYTEDASTGKPIADIPEVKGRGTVTIKNGTIKSGVKGIVSWGIQSTAAEVKIIMENVRIVTEGINSIAVDVPHASITKCTFEVENPFVINRHGSQFYAVDLRGSDPSEVSFSEFYGGQGNLVFKGNNSSIHHNYFVNQQMVTNHYSIMAMGDSSEIFENRIEPETGSGIEIYRHKGIEIFNNLIRVEASPPTTEYGNDAYSVAAIRIADYQAEPGSAGSAAENKVYNNNIFVTGRDFPDLPNYTPMVWAVYYSASGGENYIFGNQIMVDHEDPKSKAEAGAFYISGGVKGYGGSFYHNTIETNVPAAWVAARYGGASNTKIFNNKIIKSEHGDQNFLPFRMGWEPCESCYAKDVVFRSNELENMDVDITDQEHSFEVFWTLTVKVTDEAGIRLRDRDITIRDKSNQIVAEGKTDDKGAWSVELLDYAFSEGSKNSRNPYRVNSGSASESVVLDRNKTVELSIGR
jgi:hypothetical protein